MYIYHYAFAKAGADIVAPSDMMDGRILAIKQVQKNFLLLIFLLKSASSAS